MPRPSVIGLYGGVVDVVHVTPFEFLTPLTTG